jgi:hypothetical protein
MIGRLLAFIPDPLKGIDDVLAILHYGRGHKIEWQKGGGWNGATVERLLNRYGIRTYHRDYGHGKDTLGVHVPKQQAKWADHILRRAGAPLTGRALSKTTFGEMPREWGVPARGVGFAGALLDMVEPLRGKRGKR